MSAKRNRTDGDLLKDLLGPDGPELSCAGCFAELDRYVEVELSLADADAAVPGMRAHLEGCGACHEDHESLRALVMAEMGAAARPTRD